MPLNGEMTEVIFKHDNYFLFAKECLSWCSGGFFVPSEYFHGLCRFEGLAMMIMTITINVEEIAGVEGHCFQILLCDDRRDRKSSKVEILAAN